MTLGIGVIFITLISFAATWLMFGRGKRNSGREKFLYWLKSTLFLGFALTAWLAYKEPELNNFVSLILGFSLSALLNLFRSQWLFLIP